MDWLDILGIIAIFISIVACIFACIEVWQHFEPYIKACEDIQRYCETQMNKTGGKRK